MAVLSQLSPPANLSELAADDRPGWSTRVAGIFGRFTSGGDFPQFYDPLETDTPDDHAIKKVTWTAFPARLTVEAASERQRWALADSDRQRQDEYCEWSVNRDPDGRIRRVVFTSEVPEYWDYLFEADSDRLTALYEEMFGRPVTLDELRDRAGSYERDNDLNRSTSGGLAHLIQSTNNLEAAVALAATATILREDDGQPVTEQQHLVRCGRLGEPDRNSDPQIAAAVNDLAAQGAEITLEDPLGLYIDGLLTGEMEAPGGADPADFWHIERGTEEFALRASYAVPEEFGFTVSDIHIGGRPIEFGAQLADQVRVRLTAVASRIGSHSPPRLPCLG